MAFDLYLAVTDSTGAVLPGQSTIRTLRNPLRGNSTVVTPFAVGSYSFGAVTPVTSGATGPEAGKVDIMELEVVMTDDANAAALFRYLTAGKRFRTVDLLGVTSNGQNPPVVTNAVGVAPALLTDMEWNAAAGDEGPTRTLKFDGVVFSVGSAIYRPDGSSQFTFATWDVTKNTGA